MENYFEPVLSEEQMAAYLDGMLSTEENNMVEELIDSNPDMEEIQDALDSVDATFLYETNEEIPIECLADDFALPGIIYEDEHVDESFDSGEYADSDSYNDDYGYQDDSNEEEYQEENTETVFDDTFSENGYDDISF